MSEEAAAKVEALQQALGRVEDGVRVDDSGRAFVDGFLSWASGVTGRAAALCGLLKDR